MIIDFWQNVHLFNDTKILKEKAREYYTEDFISNYEKWKKNLSNFNSVIYNDMLENNIDISVWADITYDSFCKSVNDGIEMFIDTTGTITPNDISTVLQNMRINHLKKMVEASNNKHFTIDSIFKILHKVKWH